MEGVKSWEITWFHGWAELVVLMNKLYKLSLSTLQWGLSHFLWTSALVWLCLKQKHALRRFRQSLNKNLPHTPTKTEGGSKWECSPLKWWACSLLAILRFIDPAKSLSVWYLGPQENIHIVGTWHVTIQTHCKLRNVQHENNWADTYQPLTQPTSFWGSQIVHILLEALHMHLTKSGPWRANIAGEEHLVQSTWKCAMHVRERIQNVCN